MNKHILLMAMSCCVFAASAPNAGAQDGKEFKQRGLRYQAQGQLVKAIFEYRKAIAANAEDAGSHNNLALALKDLDLLDDAEAEQRAAIELKPERADYYY